MEYPRGVVRTREIRYMSMREAGVEMPRPSSATSESSPIAESRRKLFSPAPVQIFIAIFIVAAIVYSFRIGTDALGASECYSAWAAAKPNVAAIVSMPVLHDPGKQVFYYSVLHYYTRIFGMGEISLRSMSVIFSLITLVLVFALGREMFDDGTALAASTIWAFNPYAVVFAHTARMYPMFIAIALAHLLTLLNVRARPRIATAIICGVLGAAMLYTHMAGLLVLGAEAAILIRDLARSRRDPMTWAAIILASVLFVPYLPIAIRQSQQMVYGHWLDYLGPPYNYPLAVKVAAALVAAGVTLWL
ncbi:MAG TPA: glycosyltransferase family 39 protein, partial [Sporolactobacillaceae bacterium]|nr:glycosyltransferase family 39 protein [Sporolactobacillaceae bacterium]